MGVDSKRLLLEIGKEIREINQSIINPEISELTLESVRPVMALVARARAAYLKELFSISERVDEIGLPDLEDVKKLKLLRLTYEELLSASKAMETAIERGYLETK